MTAHRSKTSRSATRQNNVRAGVISKKAAEDLTLRSLVHALGISRCTRADAARWMGISRSTLTKVLAGKVPVNVTHVLRSTRLAVPFTRHLCRLVVVRNGVTP